MKNSYTGPAPELPFRSLVAFEATARLGSISRAADELDLTQSAVSQRVLKLEAFVGQRLFQRHGQGMRLTGAGELLLRTTVETLANLRSGFERIAPYKNKASLLLGCPQAFAAAWLLPRLQGLKSIHPALEVWLMQESDLATIDRIDVDLIISRKPLHTADVECVPLFEDSQVALCGPQTALAIGAATFPKLLEKAPLLFLESEPEWGGLLSTAATKSLRIKRAATIQDERLLLDAVERELGIAYLSRLHAAESLRSGRCVVLERVPPKALERLWLMRSRLTARTPIADKAFDWLLAQAAAGA